MVTGRALQAVPKQFKAGPGWSYDEKSQEVVVTRNGAVLTDLAIDGHITVEASNVTIYNVKVAARGDHWGIGLAHAKNATICHTVISSPVATGSDRLEVGIKDVYGDATGMKVLYSDISHTSTGIQFNNGLIADNYIHDLGYKEGDHLNGTTSNAGSDQLLTISHNTILNSYGQTDAVSLFQDFGPQRNALITNNLLAGGGYTIYGGANDGGAPTSNIRITNNRISTRYFPDGGSYGPLAAFTTGRGNVWSGNVWDESGRSIGL